MSSCIQKHRTVQTPELSQCVQKKERKSSILRQNLSWRLFFVARWKKVTEKSSPWTFPGTQVFVTDRLTFTWKWNPTWGKPLAISNSIWQRQNLHFRTRRIPNLTRCIIFSNSSISIVCRVNIYCGLQMMKIVALGGKIWGGAPAALSSHLRLQFSRNPQPTLSYLSVWSFI